MLGRPDTRLSIQQPSSFCGSWPSIVTCTLPSTGPDASSSSRLPVTSKRRNWPGGTGGTVVTSDGAANTGLTGPFDQRPEPAHEQVGHQRPAAGIRVGRIRDQGRRRQPVGLKIAVPGIAAGFHGQLILLRQLRDPAPGHEFGPVVLPEPHVPLATRRGRPAQVQAFGTQRLHRLYHMVGLHDHIGGGARPKGPDDPFIGAMIAVDMENDQVGVEVGHVPHGRPLQHLGRPAAPAPGCGHRR